MGIEQIFCPLCGNSISILEVNCPHQKTRGQSPGFSQRTTAEKFRPPGSRLASVLLASGVQASAGHTLAQATNSSLGTPATTESHYSGSSEWSNSEVPACIEYPGDVYAISVRSEKHDVAAHGK